MLPKELAEIFVILLQYDTDIEQVIPVTGWHSRSLYFKKEIKSKISLVVRYNIKTDILDQVPSWEVTVPLEQLTTEIYHRFDQLVELVIAPSEIYVSKDRARGSGPINLWPGSCGMSIELWICYLKIILQVCEVIRWNTFFCRFFTEHGGTSSRDTTSGMKSTTICSTSRGDRKSSRIYTSGQ